MTKIRIAINGFGRIGRSLCRVLVNHPEIELVAINDLATTENLAHLLKYDTVHRAFPLPIRNEQDQLFIEDKVVQVSHHPRLEQLDWQSLDLDYVFEATGLYKSRQALAPLLQMSGRIILTAPPSDDLKTVVLGVNEQIIAAEDRMLSNASCTTNSAAPLLKVLDRLCGIEHAFITTVHSYTTDQQLQDGPHKDFRRGRAAAESIVPTTTGAAKAITRIFPHLDLRIGGAGIRVPVPDGSLTDITFTVQKPVALKAVHEAFWAASQSDLKPYLGYTQDPIVSRDIIGQPYSCLYDEGLSAVLGRMVKVVGWYDNEMGYSHRLVDLLLYWESRS